MIDRLKLLWKSLTGEINTLKAICKLICTAIGYIPDMTASCADHMGLYL